MKTSAAIVSLFLIAVPLAHARTAGAATPPSLAEELADFGKNTRAFMNSRPTRLSEDGPPPMAELKAPFQTKLALRQTLMRAAEERARREHRQPPVAEPSPYDQAAQVVDELSLTRLEDMESARSGTVPVQPWSGDYWAVFEGGLSKRYADPRFPFNRDWKVNYDYLVSVLGLGADPKVLSPAEKYDLLVGDSGWSLSHQMQETGWSYYSGPKTVPTWVGYCHGWASAAYEVPRPAQAVVAHAPDGTEIPFYPDDVKALETALWGDLALSGQIRMTGTRCEQANPPEDANGRVTDPACFDNNPATWHLAVVNEVGVAHESMTFDASPDDEVWNQPIVGYQYSYFNPQTLLPASSLADARVPSGAFTNDKFAAYRSPNAASFVGVAMELTYLDEIKPSSKTSDSASDDRRVTVRYLYDLELASDGTIIGGEWYRNLHPDFLWRPVAGARPYTGADASIDSASSEAWDGTSALPASWLPYLSGSGASGVPAAKVVEGLLSRAR